MKRNLISLVIALSCWSCTSDTSTPDSIEQGPITQVPEPETEIPDSEVPDTEVPDTDVPEIEVPTSATIDFIGISGSNWSVSTSWTSGTLPGEVNTDSVRILNEEVNITTEIAPNIPIIISAGGDTSGGTLNINNNVSNVELICVGASQADSTGTVNHNIGEVRTDDIKIGFSNGTGSPNYNLLNGSLILTDDFFLHYSGTFNFTAGNSQLTVGEDAFFDPGSTLNIILGDNDHYAIDVGGKLTIGTGAKLIIDGTAYSKNDVTITLFDAASISGSFDTDDIALIGFGSLTKQVVQEGGRLRLKIGAIDTAPYAAQRATISALGNLTTAPILRDKNGVVTTLNPGDFKTIYYDALDYQGGITRVFAWAAIPEYASESNPVPAVVLVHGGGGTAYEDWVTRWNDRGYAAIAIAVEGQTDEEASEGGWVKHQWAGPKRTGIYDNTDLELPLQWMYHATADTILANSLMRSLPTVDKNKVGISGISWGGVITSTAIGIDNRFAFAIPIYGCGDMDSAGNWWGRALKGDPIYEEAFDPMVRIENASVPSLWVSYPQEKNFPMGQQATTYRGVTGDRMVTLIPDLGHSHPVGWRLAEPYDFADSVLETGSPWAKQLSVNVTVNIATVKFYSTKELDSASLVSTTDTAILTNERTWAEETATLTNLGNNTWQVTATLPTDVTGWYVNAVSGDLVMSSGYQGDEGGTDISPYIKIDSTGWKNIDEAVVSVGGTVAFAPHPNASGTWIWTGPNDFEAAVRGPTISDIQPHQSGEYIATYTDIEGNISRRKFTITVQ